MDGLQAELDRVEAELGELQTEHARLGAKVQGLQAQRDALTRALEDARRQDKRQVDPAGSASRPITGMHKADAIVEILRLADRPLRIAEIVDAMTEAGRINETYNTVSVYLDGLVKSGRLFRPSRGLYRPSIPALITP